MNKLKVAILMCFIVGICSKFLIVPDEHYLFCDEKVTKNKMLIGNTTFVDASYDIADSGKIIVSGGLGVTIDIESKIFMRMTGEHLYLGSWQRRISETLHNACIDLFNPFDKYYQYLKDMPLRCPLKKGVN